MKVYSSEELEQIVDTESIGNTVSYYSILLGNEENIIESKVQATCMEASSVFAFMVELEWQSKFEALIRSIECRMLRA